MNRRSVSGLAALAMALQLAGCGREEPPALHGARVAFVLEDVVALPPSSQETPRARINNLIPAPGGSARLFANDMAGKIYVIENGAVRPTPFLDMKAARASDFTSADLFEQGLSSFAFHPDFARPGTTGYGKLYTFSTERRSAAPSTFHGRLDSLTPAHHDVIAEWTVSAGNPNAVDPASRREVMRIPHPLHDHVGGHLGFNPRARPGEPDYGLLYISIGDGGNTTLQPINEVDQWRTAQDKSLPFGKLLRIDPLAKAGKPYGVPDGNPFANDPEALHEIWAYG